MKYINFQIGDLIDYKQTDKNYIGMIVDISDGCLTISVPELKRKVLLGLLSFQDIVSRDPKRRHFPIKKK